MSGKARIWVCMETNTAGVQKPTLLVLITRINTDVAEPWCQRGPAWWVCTETITACVCCRQKGSQAAERARIVEDYVQRRQAAAANKARGLADLHGVRHDWLLGGQL